MYATGDSHLWTCSEVELSDLDAVKARDIIDRCFFEAQHETFRRVKQALGSNVDASALHRSVDTAVRIAIEQAGGEWERPTKASLRGAIDILAERASSWGTPEDVFEHHRHQIEKVLDRLPDDA